MNNTNEEIMLKPASNLLFLLIGRLKIALILAAVLLSLIFSKDASAETRLYYLRVTLRNGERYETISTFDPINYCHMNGGSTIRMRDYSLIYSPQMKVQIIRTWIDRNDYLAKRWRDVLRANGMLRNSNHKQLRRIKRLTLADMATPE